MPPDGLVGLLGVCVKTEAATVFTFAGVFGLRSNSDAIVATRDDVDSVFFLVGILPPVLFGRLKNPFDTGNKFRAY